MVAGHKRLENWQPYCGEPRRENVTLAYRQQGGNEGFNQISFPLYIVNVGRGTLVIWEDGLEQKRTGGRDIIQEAGVVGQQTTQFYQTLPNIGGGSRNTEAKVALRAVKEGKKKQKLTVCIRCEKGQGEASGLARQMTVLPCSEMANIGGIASLLRR